MLGEDKIFQESLMASGTSFLDLKHHPSPPKKSQEFWGITHIQIQCIKIGS